MTACGCIDDDGVIVEPCRAHDPRRDSTANHIDYLARKMLDAELDERIRKHTTPKERGR